MNSKTFPVGDERTKRIPAKRGCVTEKPSREEESLCHPG